MYARPQARRGRARAPRQARGRTLLLLLLLLLLLWRCLLLSLLLLCMYIYIYICARGRTCSQIIYLEELALGGCLDMGFETLNLKLCELEL